MEAEPRMEVTALRTDVTAGAEEPQPIPEMATDKDEAGILEPASQPESSAVVGPKGATTRQRTGKIP